MSFQNVFHSALRQYLGLKDTVEVIGVDEYYTSDPCDTCGSHTEYEVEIACKVDGRLKHFDYKGKLSDLLDELK